MAFDPTAYLENKSQPQDAPADSGFDPISYLNNEPQKNVPHYQPTMLENAADKIRGVQEKMSPAINLAEKLQDVALPELSIPKKALGIAGQAVDTAEGMAAEKLGGMGANPYLTAAGIKAIELAAQIAAIPAPKGLMSGVAKPLAAPMESVGKSAISATLGPTTEAISARAANPESVSGAATHLQLAEKLPTTIKTIGDKVTAARDRASSFLRDSPDPSQGAIPREAIQNLLKTLQDSLQIGGATISEAAKTASSKLGSLFSDIGKVLEPPTSSLETGGIVGPTGKPLIIQKPKVFIPETDLKKIVDIAGKNINWDDKGATVANSALTDFQTRLNGVLKARNPEFANAMKPVSSLMRLYNDAMDAFSMTKKTGEGLQPTDTTISKVTSLPQERRGISQNVARRINTVTGEDLTQQSRLANFRKQFEGGRTQGSRRVNLGGIIGGGVGGGAGVLLGHSPETATLGGVVGATAGALADSFGGQIAAKFIDTYVNLNKKLTIAGNSLPADAVRRMALQMTLSALLGNTPEGQGQTEGSQ